MYCVYMHRNLKNDMVYIGVTNDSKRRWRQNGVEYKSCPRFYNAILKYGFDTFEHVILDEGLTSAEAFEFEKYCIKLFNSDDKRRGYNIAPGGNGGKVYKEHPRNMLGKSQTQYQKANQSRLMSDQSFNPMQNGVCVWGDTHAHPKGMKGKHHTAEHNAHISEIMKAKGASCKPVRVIYPDGSVKTFRSTKDAQVIGLTKPVILKLLRSGKPYEIKVINQYTEKIKHLSGIRVEYIDNTEITEPTKAGSVL